jgi:signal transduction histidine kinase
LEPWTGIAQLRNAPNNEALTMQVWATPYMYQDEYFIIFIMRDISNEKHRQSLERIFYHDVMNTAGGISGLANVILQGKNPDKTLKRIEMIQHASSELVDEIKTQRQLTKAERGEFAVSVCNVNSHRLLDDVLELYIDHEIAKQRTILIQPDSCRVNIDTDLVLVHKVLGNMIKNALEASSPGDCVTLACIELKNRICFSVHNPSVMPRNIQLQMFQKSFSTKGAGRGVGTYSIKLFGEKYLDGSVHFKSNRANGTTFYLYIPKHLRPAVNHS